MRAGVQRAGSDADQAEPGVGGLGGRDRIVAGVRVVAGAESGSGGERASGLRVRRDPGLGGASRRGGAADLVADATVVGRPCPRSSTTSATPTASTPLEVLARVACSRHKVEDFFEDAKSYLGMAQYETRSWVGWHHHMSLMAMAHLFVTLTRNELGKKRRS